MMTSEQKWKSYYRLMKSQKLKSSARRFRRYMQGERREAALERKLEAAQRRIKELEGYIDQHNQRVLKQDAVNKFLFS